MIRRLLVINLKALLAAMLSQGRSSKKRSLRRNILGTAGIAFIFLYAAATLGFFFYNIFSSLRDVLFTLNLGWLYFAINGLFVFSMCVITCVFTAQAQIFDAKDNELLLSMPLRPSDILTARVLTLLVTEYAFEALVSIPALLVWLAGGRASAPGVVFFVTGFILLPLLALAVSCLLAWLLTLLTSRLARRTTVNLIVSLAFLAGYFVLTTNAQRYISRLAENGAAIAAAFRKGFPPAYFYGVSIASGNPVGAFLFALCAIIPFALIIALLSANFVKTATTKRGAKKRKYRERAARVRSAFAALVSRELSRYFGNAMFILNMSLGSIMALAGGVALIIKRETATGVLETFAARLGLLSAVGDSPAGSSAVEALRSLVSSPAMLVALALMFTASMGCASAALISLEGRTLWILRSTPVRTRDVLLSKVCFHMIIGGAPGLLASLLAIAALFTGDLLSAALVIILPLLFTLFMALFGLALNILMPRFDWLNELQPVKQGLPVVLVMFGAMAVITGSALLYVLLLGRYMEAMAFGWTSAALFAALDALLCLWLVTRGARRFDMM